MVSLKVTKKFFFLIILKSLLSPWPDKTSEGKSIKHDWLIFFLELHHNFIHLRFRITRSIFEKYVVKHMSGSPVDMGTRGLIPTKFCNQRGADYAHSKNLMKTQVFKMSILLDKEFQPIVWRFSFRKSAFPSPCVT